MGVCGSSEPNRGKVTVELSGQNQEKDQEIFNRLKSELTNRKIPSQIINPTVNDEIVYMKIKYKKSGVEVVLHNGDTEIDDDKFNKIIEQIERREKENSN